MFQLLMDNCVSLLIARADGGGEDSENYKGTTYAPSLSFILHSSYIYIDT